ncbi:MAG TPA: recombinase family protein [Ktedonobacteraceae bacterium]|nr:recombinase family protein [Ktedonobacteraceae bacterium]
MSRSELVSQAHLQRKALIYIRQSTPHQVLSNQESLRLQYALQLRAIDLGWRQEDIEIIDADLGMTGASASHRVGFQELVTRVTLGQVGIILSVDVTRLSRNCSDWYPLLDICGYRGCLIADRDGVYDPGSANGRLLLGLKGQLSELELHTIRARMTAGLLNKAQRGELALSLPIGLVRDAIGKVRKDSNCEIQDRLDLIFTTFLRLRSASKVLQFLNAHDLCLPRRDRFGDVVWKRPTVAAILQILKNPAYAGAFVYGKTRSIRKDPASPHTQEVRLPMDQWKIRVQDVYPAYIAWETFEQIQQMLLDNYAAYDRNKSRGVPRDGAALLHGIVYCGECGHKMVVQYKNGTRYLCNYLRQQYHVPVCQYIHADPVDAHVVEAFFQALSPVELDVYAAAVATQQATTQQITHAHQQHLERLRYEAMLAQRQFNRVDPDNRLVAAELEKRWEGALAELKEAEEAEATRKVSPAALLSLSSELQTAFQAIGQHLPTMWRQGRIRQQHKKALLRALIDKVIVHRVARDQMQARIVWKGGETTTLVIPVPIGTFKDLAGAETMERIILERSAAGILDEAIAQELTDLGYRSPMGLVVLPSTVKGIRLKHGIFQKRSQSHPRRIEGALTISQLAAALDMDPHWIYDRIHNGTIQVDKDPKTHLFLFPDSPTTLEQFRQLRSGTFQNLRFSRGHQDA